MQEEKKERQEELEENGPAGEIEDPSLPEDQEEIEEEEPVEDAEEEDEPSEEAEYEDWDEEEFVPRSGCLRGCLIPIAAILAIIMVLVMIAYSKRDTIRASLLNRIVANTENHVLSIYRAHIEAGENLQLPDDMDALEAMFEKLKAAMKEGRIDEEILTEIIEEYQEATPGKLPLREKQQVINRLIEGLNAVIIASEISISENSVREHGHPVRNNGSAGALSSRLCSYYTYFSSK